MPKAELALLRIDDLRCHEETVPERVREVREEILKDGFLRKPILVDESTKIVIDGHHRLCALKELGCRFVPAVLINYRSEDICVIPWRDCDRVTKEDVIAAGLSGRLLPPKTSRHLVICEGCPKHVEYLEGELPVPLEVLKLPESEHIEITRITKSKRCSREDNRPMGLEYGLLILSRRAHRPWSFEVVCMSVHYLTHYV